MIRKATMDDLKPLAELYKEFKTYHNKLDPQHFNVPSDSACENKMKFFLKDSPFNHDSVLCHETDNVIDGFVSYSLHSYETTEGPDGSVTVYNIFVAENARRKGIGTELINELYRLAKENSCKFVFLDVHIENIAAQKFYEKMGLKPKSINMEKRI